MLNKAQLDKIVGTPISRKSVAYNTLLHMQGVGDRITVPTDYVTPNLWRAYIQQFQHDVGGKFRTKTLHRQYVITRTC